MVQTVLRSVQSLAISAIALQYLLLTAYHCTAFAFSLAKEQKTSFGVSEHRLQLRIANSSQPIANLTLYFYPGPALYGIVEEQTVNITFDYVLESSVDVRATFSTADPGIAEMLAKDNSTLTLKRIHTPDWRLLDPNANVTGEPLPHRLWLRGIFLGRTELQLTVEVDAHGGLENVTLEQTASDEDGFKYRLSVVRYMRTIDVAFRVVVWVFVLFANVGIGCEIDLRVVMQVLKRPVAPIIGLVSQYLFMPIISYCVLLVIDIPASTALGYFGIGCSPGGGASNFYCLLLGGDVSLSITMTLLSTVAALGMVPMYMFTLGQEVLKSRDINIRIPYWNILLTLLMIMIPTAIGFGIERKLPRLGRFLKRILKPVLFGFIVFMFTVGIYANLYIVKLFTPAMILAGCSLPYLGFTFGALLACAFCQGRRRVVTIALETMIQNAGLPIIILQTSLPQPDADLSLVGPVAAMTFTPAPLLIWMVARLIRRRFCPSEDDGDGGEGEGEGDDNELAMQARSAKASKADGEMEGTPEAEKFLPQQR